ncbi:MAG: response regulator transcription factor [Ignavibacteriae bacterium]|nr:response regulator transcription factor [Ignavibacteriota bacterium]
MSDNSTSNIILVDDHPLLRSGLRMIVERIPGAKVIGEYGDGEAALESLRAHSIDIAMVDVDMPKMNGIELLKKCNELTIRTSFIFLTMYNEKSLLFRLLDFGAKGFLLKETAAEDLHSCFETVKEGERYVSSSLRALLEQWKTRSKKQKQLSVDDLTPMERKILSALAQLKTNKEIAETFFISEKTVENHRVNISHKLGLQGTHALLKFAVEQKPFL